MSKILKNSELDLSSANSIVSETLNKCDDGELYLEDSRSEAIVLDDNKIKSSSYNSNLGYGLRAVTGDVVAYSHSSDLTKKSLNESSKNLKSTLSSSNGTYNFEITKTNKKYYTEQDPIEAKNFKSKIEILNQVNEYVRKKDNSVKQVTATLLGEHKSIEIIRNGGEILTDERPLVRFNVSVMLEKNGEKNSCLWNWWKTKLRCLFERG